MNTEKKPISSNNEFPNKGQNVDVFDSLIAHRKNFKSKVEKHFRKVSSGSNKNQINRLDFGGKSVNDSSKIPELTKSLFKNDPDLLIREYFITKPSSTLR